MELHDVLAKRRMVRAFTPDPVSAESRDRILWAMRRGPSAGFSQGFGFLVLDGDDARRFWEAAWPGEERGGTYTTMTEAPFVIVPCAEKRTYLDRYAEPDKGWTDRDEGRWPVPFWIIDTAFATMLALLQVVEEGLGACYFGLPHEGAVRAAFAIPDDVQPIGAIAIGHPVRDVPSPSLRRGHRNDLVHVGRWGNTSPPA